MGGTATTPVLRERRFYICHGRGGPNLNSRYKIRSIYSLRSIQAIVCVEGRRNRDAVPVILTLIAVSFNGKGLRPGRVWGHILSPTACIYELSITTCFFDCYGQCKLSLVA